MGGSGGGSSLVEGPHEPESYQPGDAVEYPVFDLIIQTGEVGVVTGVPDRWV